MTPYPLRDVRVLELAHVVAGPFTGMLLADLGADVVKVEPPGGDQMRNWPPFAEDRDGARFSHNFASVNRNKRSVVADLKDADGQRLVRELCQSADVVVENYRPGVLDRLGLGFDEVSAGHRGIVYCSISGYGLASPYVDRGAYDVVIQAMSGLMSVTGSPDGPPAKCGVPVADFVAGLYAALTIASLLPQVRQTGRSLRIDCPMLDCLIAVSALQTSEYWGTGAEPQRLGSAHSRNAPYQAFSGSDGVFVLAAGNQRLWEELCAATGLDRLRDDSRFVDQASRAANQQELAAILHGVFTTGPVASWLAELGGRGIPCGPVNDFGDILRDDHMRATGLVGELDVPVAGPTPTVVYPARVTQLPSRLAGSPPRLGEHTADVPTQWQRESPRAGQPGAQ